MNKFLIKSSIVAALGALLFGFDTAVISGTISDLVDTFHLSATSLGATVSSALVGTIIGALFAGVPGEFMDEGIVFVDLLSCTLCHRLGVPSHGTGTV